MTMLIKYKDEDPGRMIRSADNIIRFQDEFNCLDGLSDKHLLNVHKYLITQMTKSNGSSC